MNQELSVPKAAERRDQADMEVAQYAKRLSQERDEVQRRIVATRQYFWWLQADMFAKWVQSSNCVYSSSSLPLRSFRSPLLLPLCSSSRAACGPERSSPLDLGAKTSDCMQGPCSCRYLVGLADLATRHSTFVFVLCFFSAHCALREDR